MSFCSISALLPIYNFGCTANKLSCLLRNLLYCQPFLCGFPLILVREMRTSVSDLQDISIIRSAILCYLISLHWKVLCEPGVLEIKADGLPPKNCPKSPKMYLKWSRESLLHTGVKGGLLWWGFPGKS